MQYCNYLLQISFICIQVVSTNGDTHLGGEDFDQRVMDHFIKLYKKKKGKDIRKDNRAVQKLRREVEKAKRALSSSHQVRIEIESFFEGDDFSETLTRAKFEELNMVSTILYQIFRTYIAINLVFILCCCNIDIFWRMRVRLF